MRLSCLGGCRLEKKMNSKTKSENNIATRARNLLLRNGMPHEAFAEENEIEKYVTSYIIKNGEGIGSHNIRGWGIGCANWFFSQAPSKLIVVGDKVFTNEGLQYLQKLKTIEVGSKSFDKGDKDGWFLTKKLSPAVDGWYVVLVEETEDIEWAGEIRKKHFDYVSCDKFENNRFSKNAIAWRKLPEPNFNYKCELKRRNQAICE